MPFPLGIYAWAALEPEEGVYAFDWLEKMIDRLYSEGIYTVLATPTGAMPNWLTEKYEEVRQVTPEGVRHLPGKRHNYCPTSPIMREKTKAIDTALSKRFGSHPAVILWHISNEIGGNDHQSACWCPKCQAAFRQWLRGKIRDAGKSQPCMVDSVLESYIYVMGTDPCTVAGRRTLAAWSEFGLAAVYNGADARLLQRRSKSGANLQYGACNGQYDGIF